MVPWSRRSSIQAPKAPGTTAGRRPRPGIRVRPMPRNRSTEAAAGATPWPQSTMGRSAPAGIRMIGTSPPGPFRCGSTICSVKPVATAASKALPPRSSMPKPTVEAIQCVLVTAPKLPRISGRVVKGSVMSLPGFSHLGFQSSGISVSAVSGLPASRAMTRSISSRSSTP